jgi:predicted DNA-binding transcriptional regulator AlpA
MMKKTKLEHSSGTLGAAEMLDSKGVATMLGCSPRHAVRMADTGRMPRPIKLGALTRWRRTEIEAWIADGCPRVRR